MILDGRTPLAELGKRRDDDRMAHAGVQPGDAMTSKIFIPLTVDSSMSKA